MIYGSVCSGIEAATVAWHPLGWKSSFFSEIEKAPRDVLAHHYPDTPLHASRGTGERVADTITVGANQYSGFCGEPVEHKGTCSGKPTFGTLMANCGTKQWLGNQEALSGDYHVFALAGNTIGRQPNTGGNGDGYDDSGVSYTLTKADQHAVAFKVRGVCEGGGKGGGKGYLGSDDAAFTVSTNQDQHLFTNMQVRRLLPIECERLQGFPDSYTNVAGLSDSARYKALGNSMAVPVMAWIGSRIQMVEDMA